MELTVLEANTSLVPATSDPEIIRLCSPISHGALLKQRLLPRSREKRLTFIFILKTGALK